MGDPYVKFESRGGDQEFTSSVCENGHKHPKWEGQSFDIDVKYLGDDLKFCAYDEDKLGSGTIGDGEDKLSAFVCYEDWDEWFSVEFKGKPAGKIHLRTHWAPAGVEEKHSSNDEMGQIQEKIKELAQKKRELTDDYQEAKEIMDRHEEEGQKRLDAEIAEEGDDAKWDKKAQRAEDRGAETHERIAEKRKQIEEKQEEFEQKQEYETTIAIQRKDKFACEEKNRQNEEEVRNRCEALNGAQRRREEAIKDEIREIAEKMLKINEQIAERLQKMTVL